jgi:hypothetical protein
MKNCAGITLALVLALPASALALLTATSGNAPMPRQPGWADGVVEVVNLKSRVYAVWCNGNESFYYRGDGRALNEAVRKYASVKGARRVVLLPRSGQPQALRARTIEHDWRLDVPSGIYRAASGRKDAVLTVYFTDTRPRPVDRKKAEKWVRDLESDAFEARTEAERELQKLGRGAKPLLREALAKRPGLEARRRIEGLLDRLRGLDVSDLDLPPGVSVVTLDDLLAEGLKGLSAPNSTVRGLALQDLTSLAPYSDRVVPALVARLEKETDIYVRRVAAGCLGSVGLRGKPAVPALTKGLKDPDAYIRDACQRALKSIGEGKGEAGEEERIKKDLAIVKETNEFKRAARGRAPVEGK